ncbi:hypothetical protein GGF43_004150 [Coemansia sp. RSA 2618]|nr:hypothetical protein GGF43_004150 [Coemansia sp. RSA 2618]
MEFGDCVQACSFPDRGIHDFPHLEAVGQSHGDIAHRPRSAALRATHRAATYVNDCEGDTVAGSRRYWDRQSSSRILGQQDARRRSNTYVVEASPAASGYFDDEMLRRGSPARMNSNDTARELDWRHCDAQPTARIDPHQHCTDEPIEREQPRNERSLSLSSVGTMCRSDPKASNASVGLLSMVSLLYWTLLFTLGALMLDSFLCQVAGKRVMGTVDQIAHTGGDAGEISDDSVCTSSKGKQPEGSATGLTQTVGRIVRWCVEEDPGESGSNNYVHPRSLRARKASAMRGSFKFID